MVPFPSLFRARPFSGTSAAAPQAAGLAALVWSRHPDWTAEQVRGALVRAAVHAGPGRHDSETGYGRVHLPVEPVNSR
jgi:subtilisin family serine protease